jgi:hypothetical protein
MSFTEGKCEQGRSSNSWADWQDLKIRFFATVWWAQALLLLLRQVDWAVEGSDFPE